MDMTAMFAQELETNPHMVPVEGPMLKIAPVEILHKPKCCEDATGWGDRAMG